MVGEVGSVDVQHSGDTEETRTQPKEMVDEVSARVCSGSRQGTRRRGQMAAVEPERPTEKGYARRNKGSTGISGRARSACLEGGGHTIEVYLLGQPVSPFAHVLNEAGLPARSLLLDYLPWVAISPRRTVAHR